MLHPCPPPKKQKRSDLYHHTQELLLSSYRHKTRSNFHAHPRIQDVSLEFIRLVEPLFTVRDFSFHIGSFEVLLLPGETGHFVMCRGTSPVVFKVAFEFMAGEFC